MKLGRLAPHDPAAHPRLRLGEFLTAGLPAPPDVVDYISAVERWPVYLNDQIGDCTCAAAGHMIEAWSRYGQGYTVTISDQDVLAAYEAVGGYKPSDPSTDQGAVMQDVLGYWRKTGIGGHKIAAFFEVNLNDPAELRAAMNLFGHIYLGVNVPRSAMDQYSTGKPWDVVADDGGIEGGHAINWGFTARSGNHEVITWGAVQEMTPTWLAKYGEEAWVVASQEWVRANRSPAGLDVPALNAAFHTLTGQPGPFQADPTPPPAPTPVHIDDADLQLAGALHRWVRERHVADNAHAATAVRHWAAAKGLEL